jgi:Zn-dependent peptidase ImmA (M78 family)
MEIPHLMSNGIDEEISHSFQVSQNTIERYNKLYQDIISPKLKRRFLSHLIATIEDLINDRRLKNRFEGIRNIDNETAQTVNLMQHRNIRLYSILLEPADIKRRATTRCHEFGATVYYNARYEDKQIRILIAHELGHIVNKELLEGVDSENTANLFAYIAMKDKNDFYEKECKNFVLHGDLSILHEIENICPLK